MHTCLYVCTYIQNTESAYNMSQLATAWIYPYMLTHTYMLVPVNVCLCIRAGSTLNAKFEGVKYVYSTDV
jgi:hypothetical protein